MTSIADSNLLDCWLRAERLPAQTVRAMIEELYAHRKRLRAMNDPDDFPRYPVPTLGPWRKSTHRGKRVRDPV